MTENRAAFLAERKQPRKWVRGAISTPKNEYEIREDHAALFITRRDGTKLEALIDIADVLTIADSGIRFSALWNEKCKTFYAQGRLPKQDAEKALAQFIELESANAIA